MTTAAELIELLNLKPLPLEGGYFRETYRSTQRLSECDGKAASTAIYFLLTPETCSLLHRLPADEVYHFYLGDPVEMLLLDNSIGRIVIFGSDILSGQLPQCIVPAGTWQGSCLRPGGAFALMGTTVAPGFDFSDWQGGDRVQLFGLYPAFADHIVRLTVAPG
jgi:predicted cupin superfamily sugar epimerase